MMINLKSVREQKRKLYKETFISQRLKIKYHNSRNKTPLKFQSSNKTLQMTISREKETLTIQEKNKINNTVLEAEKKMILNLKKYNITPEMYNKKIINDIIYDENKHIVSQFKNYLLWDENSEFLKRFYLLHESLNRLPKINYYYEKYTLFSPVYFSLDDLVKIMNKNVKKKKKYFEKIEELEDFNNDKKEDLKLKEFTNLINPKDISETITIEPSCIQIDNKYEIHSISIQNNFTDENSNNNNNYNLKDFDKIVNFIVNDGESLINNKNNKIINDNIDNEKQKSINSNNYYESDFDINNSLCNIDIEDKEPIKNEDNALKKKEGKEKTTIPKIGKILEVKKLNFQNLNKMNYLNNSHSIKKKKMKQLKIFKMIFNDNIKKITKKKSLISINVNNQRSKKILKNSSNNISMKKIIKKKSNDKIPITERVSSLKKLNLKTKKFKFDKSFENMIKIIQYSKTSSRREKNNSKNKKKKNKEINTISKSKSKSLSKNKSKNLKQNKFLNTINKKNNSNKMSNKNFFVNKLIMTSPNFTPLITTPSSFSTNNNITNSIYNINLNLNLGNSNNNTINNNNHNTISNYNTINKSNLNKKFSNNSLNLNKGKSVFTYSNRITSKQKYKNIRNIIPINNQTIPFSNLFKFKKNFNKNSKRLTINNKKDNKISYDINTGIKNFNISIHKSGSNTIVTDNVNSNSSVNIHVNYIEKNSRNENLSFKNKKIKKKLIIPFDIKYSKSTSKLKTLEKKNINYIKSINKDNGIKRNCFLKDKKYAFTSRNERDIPFELINEILKKNYK